MKTHPIAAMFPMMDAQGLDALAQDIKLNGQRVPVTLWREQIIDGRNRWKACEVLGLSARTEDLTDKLTDEAQVANLIVSMNLHRRHLNESQRAMLGARIKHYFEPAAREREVSGKADPRANLPEGQRARDEAAKVVNVSPRSVEHASKVIKSAVPEIVAMVDEGKVAASAAALVSALPKEKQGEVAKQGPAGVKLAASEQRVKPRQKKKPKRGSVRDERLRRAMEQLDALEEMCARPFTTFPMALVRRTFSELKENLSAWIADNQKEGA